MQRELTSRKLGALKTPSALAAGMLMASALLSFTPARASDHADTAENYNRIGADMTDVYIFPSPQNADNVVLVMDVRGLIPAGQTGSFDPGVLYQIKIDTTGDSVEDLVIQSKFEGSGTSQRVRITPPIAPPQIGLVTTFNQGASASSLTNRAFNFKISGNGRRGPGRFFTSATPRRGVGRGGTAPVPITATAFAGLREEPFFIDLERLFQIFPDRMTPLTGTQVDLPDPNTPKVNGFRGFSTDFGSRNTQPAQDFFANMNVLSIVVELPRASLGGGVIRVWETTSVANGSGSFTQQDRLARPIVNEVFATVTARRHEANNKINPTQDPGQIRNDIPNFMKFPAGRSDAIANVVAAVLVPDTMTADLSQPGPAAYLGVETGGATGGKFGGRKLTDDVVDISLGVIFGNTIPALGLAPNDGKALPQFTTDNVGFQAKRYKNTFPYVGDPR